VIAKMMMLVAAKWRDFSQQNPHQDQPEFEATEEPEYQPKSSTSRHKVFELLKKIFLINIFVTLHT